MIWKILGLILMLAAGTLGAAPADAITIYPIDRAQILAGSRFDLKVEFDGVVNASEARVTIDGKDLPAVLGRSAAFVEREDGVAASAMILRDVSLTRPGRYAVVASDGKSSRTVRGPPDRGTHPDRRHQRRQVSRRSGHGCDDQHGAGRHRRSRLDHHRLGEFDERLHDRAQVERERARRVR